MDPITLVFTSVKFLIGLNALLVLVGWFFYFVLVSLVVKYAYGNQHPSKVPALVSAAIGTVIGYGFNSALHINDRTFSISGLALAVCGTICFLWGYNRLHPVIPPDLPNPP